MLPESGGPCKPLVQEGAKQSQKLRASAGEALGLPWMWVNIMNDILQFIGVVSPNRR